MEIELSPDRILKKPSLHDGCLYGIVAGEGKEVRLMVKDHQKKPYVISLGNVGSMNVMHFWGGDIILDVSLIPIKEVPLHTLQGLFHDRITDDRKISDAISREGRKYLFVLECSYGAEVFATCDQMQVAAE